MNTLDALWQVMFIGSISAAALIVTLGIHITRLINTGRPEDSASLTERENRIARITISCSLIFIFYGVLGMPYSLSIFKDYCEQILKFSYILFFPSLAMLIIILLGFGIIFHGNVPKFSHDPPEGEPFYNEFMARQP